VDGVPASPRQVETTSTNNRETGRQEVHSMLYTIAVVLLVLWLLGLVISYTLGGFIHILLVFAVVMVLVNLISGRRAL
jgi:predicted ferric reductase